MKTNQIITNKFHINFIHFILVALLLSTTSFKVQSQSILAKWDFNSNTIVTNGVVSVDNPIKNVYGVKQYTAPIFSNCKYSYNPNYNSGCGAALLYSCHCNTDDFMNAICLSNFYYSKGACNVSYDPNSSTFDPEGPANLNIDYTFPVGKTGCLSSFQLKILQSWVGKLKAEKQGVAVFRNGALIYNETKNIVLADVNKNPLVFDFPTNDPNFCADGTSQVSFKISFALVKILPVSSIIGYDDLILKGSCPYTPPLTISTIPTTCAQSGSNSDGTIKVTGGEGTEKFQFSLGSTFNTGAAIPASPTMIPPNGIIVDTLSNPSTPRNYTVRITSSTGAFIQDITTALNPGPYCPNCIIKLSGDLIPIQATCNGDVANDNAQIQVASVVGGTRVGISAGTTYSGPDFANATPLISGGHIFTGLPNPLSSQVYTVRIYKDDDLCYIDKQVTLNNKTCGCSKIVAELISSNSNDTNLANNSSVAQICTDTSKVDLELLKSVLPTSGSNCPTATEFTWTVTLFNNGIKTAKNITVLDALPSGLVASRTAVTSKGTFYSSIWTIDSLTSGQSATLTLYTKASQIGTFTNCAEVMSYTPDNDPDSSPGNGITTEDDYACSSISVLGTDLPTVQKSFSPARSVANSPVTLKINLINNENNPIQLIAPLIDTLPSSPAQLVIDSNPNLISNLSGVIANPGGITITIPQGTTLLPGSNLIQLKVIPPSDGVYCNVIKAGALKTEACNNLQETEACLEIFSDRPVPPVITKSITPSIIQVGQTATLTLTISNQNAQTMHVDQDLIDYFPPNLVAVGSPSGTCPNVTLQNGGTELVMAAGTNITANTTCTISVPIKSDIAGTYCNKILMGTLITTVDTTNNLINSEVSEACLDVIATPCTTLDLTGITPSSVSLAVNGNIDLSALGTGLTQKTIYQWSGTGTFSSQDSTTNYKAPSTAGTYTLKVLADNKLTGYGTCKDSITMNVSVCTNPSVSLSGTNLTCNSAHNGAVTTNVTGNVGAVTYLWSNGATTANISSLNSGVYSVTVTETALCKASASVTITEPTPMLLTCNKVDVTVHSGTNGQASVNASGGVSPYTYLWSNGATTSTITNLTAGNYSVTVNDSNNCTSTCSSQVNEPGCNLSATASGTNIKCNGVNDGTASVSYSGTTNPVTYQWSNGATTSSISGLSSGTYNVTVTENATCFATANYTVINTTIPLIFTTTHSEITCNGASNGSITITANGGVPPYQYSINNGQSFQANNVFTGLGPSNYVIKVKDANSCITTCF